MVGEWKKLSRDCDREKLDLEDKTSAYSTLKSERKLIAGEGKNKERRDAERERKEETRQGEGERGRKKRRGERRGREKKKSRRETERERERESREAGWESNHTFESIPLPARE